MPRKLLLFALLVTGCAWLSSQQARADVKPHALFSDGMVLQRDMKVPIWGTADDGEKVTVSFQGQHATTTAKDGKWRVRLEKLKAGGPSDMTIAGKNHIQIKDVLVGEVWICSGQSNMEMSLKATANAQQVIANSKNPMIHLFTVPKTALAKPTDEVKGKWSECGPDTVGSFSAVAYYFGRDLQKALEVPIGLIHTSWGGTPAEAWTSREALEANPELKYYFEREEQAAKTYPAALERYKAELAKYKEAAKQARAEGKKPPQAPRAPNTPFTGSHSPSALYNGMIAPLIPYAIRGAIWYQGESNAGKAYEYRTLLPTMIQSWRTAWKEGDFPFLLVQLAPFMKIQEQPGESAWAELREAQLLTTLKVPNTAEAVITDVGEENDIHPKRKEPVGARLARAALALAYGRKIEYSGPVYDKMTVEGKKAILSFTHVDGGLEARGGSLQGFTIAGEDHKFVNAEAKIEGDKVVVSSPQVEHPVAVRYGWANYPVVNLWNKEGLPASPFRTDDFPGTTQPKKTAARDGKTR